MKFEVGDKVEISSSFYDIWVRRATIQVCDETNKKDKKYFVKFEDTSIPNLWIKEKNISLFAEDLVMVTSKKLGMFNEIGIIKLYEPNDICIIHFKNDVGGYEMPHYDIPKGHGLCLVKGSLKLLYL